MIPAPGITAALINAGKRVNQAFIFSILNKAVFADRLFWRIFSVNLYLKDQYRVSCD